MSTCLETALLLNSLRMFPVLISSGKKGPTAKAWQDKRYSDDELRERFGNNPEMNVGALLGPDSGIIALDRDTVQAVADLDELFDGEIPATPGWKSKHGGQDLFAWDDRLEALGAAVVHWKEVEVRLGAGDKAAQSVVPPSTTDGFTREWTTPLSADCLPAKLPESVIQKLLTLVEKPKPIEKSKPKVKHQIEDDYCCNSDWKFLEAHDWKLGGDHPTRPGKEKGASASFCTAEDGTRLLHVFSTNAQPLEADKNYNAFDAYRLLNHDGNTDAARADLAKQGYGRKRIELITSKELASNDYTLEYHIPNVLVKGQPCIFAGAKKAGKTSIGIDLAISLASGERFLGRFAVNKPCNVVMLSGESGLATIKETAHRISQSKGISLDGLDKLQWSEFLPLFNDDADLNAVERMIEESHCEVLFVDPVYLCMDGVDAGNIFVQGGKLRPIGEVCQRHGVTLILLHHTRKQAKPKGNADRDPPELDDMAWAGFGEYARQWFLLGRRRDYVPGTGQHQLWLSLGGSAGHSGLLALDLEEGVSGTARYWKPLVSSASEVREEKKANTARERIMEAILNFPNGQTKTALLEAASVRSTNTAQEVIDALVRDGKLVHGTVKKGVGSYPGYLLATAV